MADLQTSLHEHAQFDTFCASVEDYETLPEVEAAADPAPGRTDSDRLRSIDDEILAGLVSP